MRLCLGSLLTVMNMCLSSIGTNFALCTAMFKTVAPNHGVVDKSNASAYAIGKNNAPGDVTEGAAEADPHEVAKSFEHGVIKYVEQNKRKDVALALQEIIVKDETLDDDTQVELVNNLTKAQVRGLREFVFHEFLAGIFLYTLQTSNAKLQVHVKEITNDFMENFANKRVSVSFVGKYGATSIDAAKSIGADSVALALTAEAGAKCLRCGKQIAVIRNAEGVDYGMRYTLYPGDDIVVCANCSRELAGASEEEKQELLRKKRYYHMRSMAREAASAHKLSDEIRKTLIAVSKMKASPQTELKEKPTKVENKVTDEDLKELILLRVTHKYQGVNDELYRLSGEDKVVMDEHAKIIRRMYEDAKKAEGIDQTGIFNELVNAICAQTGENMRTAADIVVSYFVQRCEVFDEAPQQSDPVLKIGDSPVSTNTGDHIQEANNAQETA